MSDREFIDAFERCEIAAADFHHRDHVRLGWAYLEKYEVLDALVRFRDALRKFAAHHGAAGLYHETITFAFLLLINERRARSVAATWDEFANSNDDLFAWKPSLLDRYYATDTLASELARKTFIFPDRIA